MDTRATIYSLIRAYFALLYKELPSTLGYKPITYIVGTTQRYTGELLKHFNEYIVELLLEVRLDNQALFALGPQKRPKLSSQAITEALSNEVIPDNPRLRANHRAAMGRRLYKQLKARAIEQHQTAAVTPDSCNDMSTPQSLADTLCDTPVTPSPATQPPRSSSTSDQSSTSSKGSQALTSTNTERQSSDFTDVYIP